MPDRVTIKIPRELYHTLKEMIAGSGFSSVNEFVVFVLRTVASGGKAAGPGNLSAEEIALVRERLRNLGYLKE